jgi:TatD DNase family protein
MGWIDTHAHLADPSLFEQIDAVLERADRAGMEGILCVAVDLETSEQCLQIASNHAAVRASVGIHPNYVHQASSLDWDRVVRLANSPRTVALGESGLDKYWKDSPFELQLDFFARTWELSRQTDLPVIVHMRECEPEMLQALALEYKQKPLRGVMHSFSGSSETAMSCLEMGMYISFAGMLTYKKSVQLRETASRIPLDRLLVETDCPYLSPEPNRSKRPNEPAWLVHTAAVLAEIHGVDIGLLREATHQNSMRLFDRWNAHS